MQKSKIIIDAFVLNKISNSSKITNNEKVNFLKHVWYLTNSEKRELVDTL